MAKSSAMPLLLVAGGAALLMSGKKKSRTKGNGASNKADEDRRWIEVGFPDEYSEVGSIEKLMLDQECTALAKKLDPGKHNAWVTSRYMQLVAEGVATSPDDITLTLLREQSDHCPWDDRASWTPLMKSLYDQLLAAVEVYHAAVQRGNGSLGQTQPAGNNAGGNNAGGNNAGGNNAGNSGLGN
jgi:hypothetical protein